MKSRLEYRSGTIASRIGTDINLDFGVYFGSMRAARKTSNETSQISVERVDWKAT